MNYTIKHNGAEVGRIRPLTGLAARDGHWYWEIDTPRAIRNGFNTTLEKAKKAAADSVQWPIGVTFERRPA